MGGFRFRRQHPIGPYSLDFYCPETRLAVETDGFTHNDPDQLRRDKRRGEWLTEQSIRTLRIPSTWATDPDDVLQIILDALRPNAPSVTP